MRISKPAFTSALLLGLVACQTEPPPMQPTPQAQAMQSMLGDVDQIRAFVYGGGSQPQAESAANELVMWSGKLAGLFPPGVATAEYVDMSPARVAGAPPAMQRTTAALLVATRTGDRAKIGDALMQTEREGCGFCHRSTLFSGQ